MERYKYYNPNSKKKNGADCVVRAICKATNQTWLDIYDKLVEIGREKQEMPNCKPVYNTLLKEIGFEYKGFKMKRGQHRLTVEEFAQEHPCGTYICNVARHLVTVKDGYYYDTWDSGDYCVYSYYYKG